jgi:hypothetical protein
LCRFFDSVTSPFQRSWIFYFFTLRGYRKILDPQINSEGLFGRNCLFRSLHIQRFNQNRDKILARRRFRDGGLLEGARKRSMHHDGNALLEFRKDQFIRRNHYILMLSFLRLNYTPADSNQCVCLAIHIVHPSDTSDILELSKSWRKDTLFYKKNNSKKILLSTALSSPSLKASGFYAQVDKRKCLNQKRPINPSDKGAKYPPLDILN